MNKKETKNYLRQQKINKSKTPKVIIYKTEEEASDFNFSQLKNAANKKIDFEIDKEKELTELREHIAKLYELHKQGMISTEEFQSTLKRKGVL